MLHYSSERTLVALYTSRHNRAVVHTRIREWIRGCDPHEGGTVARRRQLLTVAEQLASTGQLTVEDLGEIVITVLLVGFKYTRQKPGKGDSFTFFQGMISFDDIREVAEMWPRVLQLLHRLSISTIQPV